MDYSEMATFKFCRQRWHYQYRMGLVPRHQARALLLGDVIHRALAHYHMGGIDTLEMFADAYDEEQTRGEEELPYTEEDLLALAGDKELGESMLLHYMQHYQHDTSFHMVCAEASFEVSVPGSTCIQRGRIDGFIQDSDGDYWIIEHKTARTLPDPEWMEYDEQSRKYQWAAQQCVSLGLVPNVPSDTILHGVLYNGLRKDVPREPALLKSGKGLSIQLSASTTHEVFLSAIYRHGFDPKDYEEHLEKLRFQGNPFFRRIWHRRFPSEIEATEANLIEEHREMNREAIPIYPSPSMWGCKECSYKLPCKIKQEGGDEQQILSVYFRKRVHDADHAVSEQLAESTAL